MRNTWRFFDYSVSCRGCDWEYYGKNGLGLAAQHHDRTGHSIGIDVEGHISYLNDEDHQARKAKRKA